MSISRREALAALMSAPVVSSIEDVETIEGDIEALVITVPVALKQEAKEQIKETIEKTFRGTKLATKSIILTDSDCKIQAIRVKQ